MNDLPNAHTCLYGNELTEKDNPVIVFRGKLDTLCAMITEAQLLGESLANRNFAHDLAEALGFVRSLLPAEYKRIPLGEIRILGLSSEEVREQSHHPERYFGRGHLLTDYTMGALSVRLNLLRAFTREAELAAVTALPDRQDILEALNRLSSLFYILMYKYLPENYTSAGDAGI